MKDRLNPTISLNFIHHSSFTLSNNLGHTNDGTELEPQCKAEIRSHLYFNWFVILSLQWVGASENDSYYGSVLLIMGKI